MEEVEPLSQVNLIQSHCVPTCLCYIEGYDHKNKVSSPTNCKSFSLIWIGIINSSILVHAHYYNVTKSYWPIRRNPNRVRTKNSKLTMLTKYTIFSEILSSPPPPPQKKKTKQKTTHTHNYKILNLVGTLLDKENSTHLFGLIYG